MLTVNNYLARAGEFRVASEILRRGAEVYMTVTNSSIDLVMGNGNKIQVKAASRNERPIYTFSFKSWRKDKGSLKHSPHLLEEIDFVILWGSNTDLFLIVPAPLIRGKQTLHIPLGGLSKWLGYKDRWDLLFSPK
jgi:hypothetical protein